MDNRFSRGGAASISKVETEAIFMAGVYRWMMTGLSITGGIAFVASRNATLMNIVFNTPLLWVLMIGELGLVFYLSAKIERISNEKAGSLFYIYSALNGLTMAGIFLVYTGSSIASTFFVTAGTFGAMSLYGYTTKKDLTSWGSFFFMGLIGVILASVVNIFMQSTALYFAINCIGVLVFVGLTAYDTQKIKNTLYNIGGVSSGGEAVAKVELIGALTLYLDFINLFLFMLHFMGGRSDD